MPWKVSRLRGSETVKRSRVSAEVVRLRGLFVVRGRSVSVIVLLRSSPFIYFTFELSKMRCIAFSGQGRIISRSRKSSPFSFVSERVAVGRGLVSVKSVSGFVFVLLRS